MLFTHIWEKGLQGKAWRLIKMLYERVDNKVIFGHIESEVFEVHNGLKQGCALSPSLFNLVMTDLDHALTNSSGGVDMQHVKVHGLYYADDIVLLAKSEDDLQCMLASADEFANKWNLSFNDRKSKILIIGKRLSSKQWKLGNKSLVETNSYKYLGILINRRVKDNTHIQECVHSKATKQSSYIRYNLANHSDINRVAFGNTLWTKVVIPSLAHAAGVWFNETAQSQTTLQSAQYKCAKSVLKLHSKPSRIATTSDLGWLPLLDELDIRRISYFIHMKQMQDTRLTKIIFNELLTLYDSNVKTNFNYFENIKAIFENQGLDHWFHSDFPVQNFKEHVINNSLATNAIKTFSMPSLQHYDKQVRGCSPYLLSKECFKSIQLKFKIRTGVAALGENLYRQHRGTGLCPHCGQFESIKHFVLICKAYHSERQKMYMNLRGTVEDDTFNQLISSPNYALAKVMGEHDDIFNQEFLKFLSAAWTIRQQ